MRDHHHQRRGGEQREAADDLVEQPFHHDVPIGDRAVEHVEHRHAADIGIGARPETQLVAMRRQADVDRQHPELLEHLQDAVFGRDRQREDHKIDAGAAREFDEIVDGAELLQAAAGGGCAVVAAVVEHADHAHVAVRLRAQRTDQAFAGSPPPTMTVRRVSRPSRIQRAPARRAPAATRAARSGRSRRSSRTRRGRTPPSFPKNDTAVASRNTIDQAETSRAI